MKRWILDNWWDVIEYGDLIFKILIWSITLRNIISRANWSSKFMFGFSRKLARRGGMFAVALGLPALMIDLVLILVLIEPLIGLGSGSDTLTEEEIMEKCQ